MSYLCLSVRFLQPYFHGRGDGGEPEWPPSPLRLFQSLVAAAARRWDDSEFRHNALPLFEWLERLCCPLIIAPAAVAAKTGYRLYVPDNSGDRLARSWQRGHEAGVAQFRTEKDVRPMRLEGESLHYLLKLDGTDCPPLSALTAAAQSMTHLGWGVDMVVADVRVMTESEAATLAGERWQPEDETASITLRAPVHGTFDDLSKRHQAWLNRVTRDAKGNESLATVPPLTVFRVSGYRRVGDPVARPFAVFELRNDDGSWFAYRQERLIHIAGMVRHLAIELMSKSPPDDVDDRVAWVDSYVAGHVRPGETLHRQFSYLPLPSIRSVDEVPADPAVRRVAITAPPGDGRYVRQLAMLLDGRRLSPDARTELPAAPTLVRGQNDGVARLYTKPASVWSSVTPVILPGHDDHKPAKRNRLIETALRQCGIEQTCEYEWSALSRFPRSLSAYKYDRQERPIGYIRPDHLLSQTAVHLTVRFDERVRVPGPLAIGAGRHCGLGVFARVA